VKHLSLLFYFLVEQKTYKLMNHHCPIAASPTDMLPKKKNHAISQHHYIIIK